MYTLCIIYLYNCNDLDRVPLKVLGHDVERYVRWFVTWGVLCHLTITKILKGRCGGHTPEGPLDLATTPRHIVPQRVQQIQPQLTTVSRKHKVGGRRKRSSRHM
jgi:hypothetical protein